MAIFTANAAQAVAPAIYNAGGTTVVTSQRSVAVALSAGDVYQMVKVPAGAVITEVILVSDLFGGGNATMTVGDGNSSARYIAAQSTSNSAIGRLSVPSGLGYSYSATDTIDITFSAVASASAVGSVKLTVFYTNGNPQ